VIDLTINADIKSKILAVTVGWITASVRIVGAVRGGQGG